MRILLVEDDPHIGDGIAAGLKKARYGGGLVFRWRSRTVRTTGCAL